MTPSNVLLNMFRSPATRDKVTNIPYGYILSNPLECKEILERILGSDIHIHHPDGLNKADRTYVNNRNVASFDWIDKEGYLTLYNSGLYKLGELPGLWSLGYSGPPTDLSLKYEGSIFPTRDAVKALIGAETEGAEIIRRIKATFGIDQKTLFERFPGIHYNLVCRSPCVYENLPQLHRRRAMSESAINESQYLDVPENANVGTYLSRVRIDRLLRNRQYGVIRDFIHRFPEEAKTHQFPGGMLLGIAINVRAPEDIIFALISEASLLSRDSKGNTPLLTAIDLDYSDAVLERLMTPASLATMNYEITLPVLALVIAQRSNEIIHLAIERNPATLQFADQDKRLLLHHAIDYYSEFPVLKTIIETYPDALHKEDIYGLLPLHGAVARNLALDTIRFIIDGNPMALQHPDDVERLPLHVACKVNSPLPVVQLLIERFPPALKARDLALNMPIHYAIQACTLDIIQELLKAYPEGIANSGEYSQLPLHKAVEAGRSLDILTFLVKKWKHARNVPSYRNGRRLLPIDYLKPNYYSSELEALVKQLLQPDPQFATTKTARRRKNRRRRRTLSNRK